MSASVKWSGLNELIRTLDSAPDDIRDEALDIIKDETEGAAREIAQQSARKTGTLQRRVRTEFPSSTILVGKVISAAPHAHMYEFGTAQRRTATGANRGRMPERDVTVPVARRRRSVMFTRLVNLLRRRGFVVTP